MASVLRQLQAEWNELVPAAQAAGIRRVRRLNAPLEPIAYRREKLEWLRRQLAGFTLVPETTEATWETRNEVDFSSLDLARFTFGVELEFILPMRMGRYELARLLTEAGVPCESQDYNHRLVSVWKLVTDGSLGNYTRGTELVSPVLQGEAGMAQLAKACAVLKASGCKISKKCGYHVHVGGMDAVTARHAIMGYASTERLIDSFMAPSRRASNNGFCQPVRIRPAMATATTMDEVALGCYQSPGRSMTRSGSRYCKVNVQSFWQHGTVEFRHHQGTIEADRAVNWVRVLMRMCSAAARGPIPSVGSVEELLSNLNCTPAERNYFVGRVTYFNRQIMRVAA
jgi:hypothetical protein